MTVNGVRHSMLTLTSTALGGGVLSVSYVMRISGLALGTSMIVLGAMLAFLSTKALMVMSRMTGHSTYAGLLSHCAGRVAGPVLDAMLFIYGNGSIVGYMVFLGDFIPSLVSLGGPVMPHWLASRELAILGSALLLAPLVLQRDLSVLRYIAPVSIIALMYMAITVAVKAPVQYTSHEGSADYGTIRWAIPNIRLTDAFAICVFAFNCHLNVLPVAGAMVRPTKARIEKVSMRVNLLQMCFYGLIGTTGYLSFLAQTPGDLIKAYPTHDVAVIIGRVMLTGTMLVAIPLNLSPTVRSGLQIRDYFRGSRDALLAPSPTASPCPSPRAQAQNAPESLQSNPDGSLTLATGAERACGLRVVLTLICLVCQAVLAILVPGVADVIGLLGATVATAMMMAIPAYCMGVVMPKTAVTRLQQAVLYLFSLVSLASVPVKILTWTKVIS